MSRLQIPVGAPEVVDNRVFVEYGSTSVSTLIVLRGSAWTSDIPSHDESEDEEWARLEAEAFSGAELDRIAEYLRETGQAST